MRTADFFAGVLCPLILLLSSALQAESHFLCAADAPATPAMASAAKALGKWAHPLPTRGRVHVLVVFAGFQDEHTPVPTYADDLFAVDQPGSLAHYYDTMSFGQLQVEGTALPRRYRASQPAAAYLAAAAGEKGRYGDFVGEILQQVDADLDLSRFDNDGADLQAGSDDDDGRVDYVFILLSSIPRGFINGGATGVAGLGFKSDYLASDLVADATPVVVSRLPYYGAIVAEDNFVRTVGAMAHEFAHGLGLSDRIGLPDLYDVTYKKPADDSAGIGRWGLMGRGAHGWNADDGPAPLCAWSRERLGWIGRDNERLVEVEGDATGLRIDDLQRDGTVYKILLPAQNSLLRNGLVYREYLLLEQRIGDAYYNRHQPADGLLVWHIRQRNSNNSREERKTVDLVCADGLYADAGYPLGQIADGRGGDNLDFWAHDAAYARAHGGNLGDATDPFDGEHFARLDLGSNPSSALGENYPAASAGLALNMRRSGLAMIVDVRQPRWSGSIAAEIHWSGEIFVDGDLTVAPEGKLVVHANTRVRLAGADHLQSGADPAYCEVRVEGELVLDQRPLRRAAWGGTENIEPEPAIFEAQVPGERWVGIVPLASASLRVEADFLMLRDALRGLDGAGPVVLSDVPTLVADISGAAPETFELLPNFPNPFNPETTLRFALPQGAQVHLTIYNALGQTVRHLVDEALTAGVHTAVWDGRDGRGESAASGIYFYRLAVGDEYAATRQMTLLR